MKLRWHYFIAFVLGSIAISSLAWAQSGAAGGGKFSEWDFQTYIARLGAFMETEEGRKAFPEIRAYDLSRNPNNPKDLTFKQLCDSVKVAIKNKKVRDSAGNVRDCVAFRSPENYIQCNGRGLPRFTVANQPKFYGMSLHELLVILGLEKPPANPETPSEYPISRRIKDYLHYESYGEWLLGRLPVESVISGGMWCAGSMGAFDSAIFVWNRKQFGLGLIRDLESRYDVRVLYRGEKDLPNRTADTLQESQLRQESEKEGYPAIKGFTSVYGSLDFTLFGNPFSISRLSEISPGFELWSQIPAQFMAKSMRGLPEISGGLQCQALESWSESDLAAQWPGILDKLLSEEFNQFSYEKSSRENKDK